MSQLVQQIAARQSGWLEAAGASGPADGPSSGQRVGGSAGCGAGTSPRNTERTNIQNTHSETTKMTFNHIIINYM